jgi:hypothetical protein
MKALKAKKHSNKFLQADFEKGVLHEGNDDFLFFYILEEMKESSREARLESEEKWISIHFDGGKNCYNLCNRAISREGSASKSETRQKISEAISKLWEDPEYRNKIPVFGSGENNPNYGKSLSEETKSKLREARMKQVFTKEQIEKRAASLRGKPRSEETKRKISIAKKRKQKVAE